MWPHMSLVSNLSTFKTLKVDEVWLLQIVPARRCKKIITIYFSEIKILKKDNNNKVIFKLIKYLFYVDNSEIYYYLKWNPYNFATSIYPVTAILLEDYSNYVIETYICFNINRITWY